MARKGRSRGPAPRASMMQQIEEMQRQMAEAQSSLENETVVASVGGGAVTIEMTGAQEVRAVTLKPEVLDPEDIEFLQDMLIAAFNEALSKSQELAADRLGPLTGGLDIPGLT